MESNSGKSTSSPGLAAATERFPALARQVEELFALDEDFRGLCEDLADAQQALKACQRLPADIQPARRREYEELVSSLTDEIKAELSRTNIIPLHPPRS